MEINSKKGNWRRRRGRGRKKAILELPELPENVIQHIQSFMPEKDAVRSCIFSKSWFRAWCTRPALSFRQDDHPFPQFVFSVQDTLARYLDHDLDVESFDLSITNGLDVNMVNSWLGLISVMGIKVLTLSVKDEYSEFYVLDSEHIFGAETLQELNISTGRFCRRPYDTDMPSPIQLMGTRHVRTDTAIKCHSLAVLTLYDVHLEDQLLQDLFANCPLLEELAIDCCTGLKQVRVPNFLDQLKQLMIRTGGWQLETVVIDNPSLQSFSIMCSDLLLTDEKEIMEAKWEIIEAENLTNLTLEGRGITDAFFHRLISNYLPSLQTLRLDDCGSLHNVYISSPSLENFELIECDSIAYIKIECPNLLRFRYKFDGKWGWPGVYCNSNSKCQLRLNCSLRCIKRAGWISRLRRLLEPMADIKLSLSIINNIGHCLEPEPYVFPPLLDVPPILPVDIGMPDWFDSNQSDWSDSNQSDWSMPEWSDSNQSDWLELDVPPLPADIGMPELSDSNQSDWSELDIPPLPVDIGMPEWSGSNQLDWSKLDVPPLPVDIGMPEWSGSNQSDWSELDVPPLPVDIGMPELPPPLPVDIGKPQLPPPLPVDILPPPVVVKKLKLKLHPSERLSDEKSASHVDFLLRNFHPEQIICHTPRNALKDFTRVLIEVMMKKDDLDNCWGHELKGVKARMGDCSDKGDCEDDWYPLEVIWKSFMDAWIGPESSLKRMGE